MSGDHPTPETPPEPARGDSHARYGRRFLSNVSFEVIQKSILIPARMLFMGYLVRALGPEDFGLVAISLGVLASMSVLQLGNAVAIGKRVNGALVRGDDDEVRAEFSAGSALILLTLIPITIGLILVQTVFWSGLNIPADREWAGRVVIGAIGSQIVVTALVTPALACMHALHRLDINSKLMVAATLVRIGVTIAWFELVEPDPAVYGIIMISAGGARLLVSWVWARHALPQARIHWALASWVRVKSLALLNVLAALNNMARALFVQIPIFVVQIYGGLTLSGLYGIGAQLVIYSLGILSIVTNPTTPVVVSLEAKNRLGALRKLLAILLKTYLSAGAFVLLFLLTLGPVFLDLWIRKAGVEPLAEALPFVGLMVMGGLLGEATKPFLVAREELKWPVVVGAILAAVMIGIQALLAWMVPDRHILYWMTAVAALCFGAYNLFSVLVAARSVRSSIRSLLADTVFAATVSVAAPGLLLVVVKALGWASSWLGLLLWLGASGVLMLLSTGLVGLRSEERTLLMSATKR